MSKKYTVIGLYEDNHQPWAAWVKARSTKEAAANGVKSMIALNQPGDPEDEAYIAKNLLVMSVLAGHHKDLLGSDELIRGNEIIG